MYSLNSTKVPGDDLGPRFEGLNKKTKKHVPQILHLKEITPKALHQRAVKDYLCSHKKSHHKNFPENHDRSSDSWV